MSSGLVVTLFRGVVIAGALAASVYAAMVPLSARSGEITEIHRLASSGSTAVPEAAGPGTAFACGGVLQDR